MGLINKPGTGGAGDSGLPGGTSNPTGNGLTAGKNGDQVKENSGHTGTSSPLKKDAPGSSKTHGHGHDHGPRPKSARQSELAEQGKHTLNRLTNFDKANASAVRGDVQARMAGEEKKGQRIAGEAHDQAWGDKSRLTGPAPERKLSADASEAFRYWRGVVRPGSESESALRPEARQALDMALKLGGHQAAARLIERHGSQLGNYLERVLPRGSAQLSDPGRFNEPSKQEIHRAVNELTSLLKLGTHFDHVEKTGGPAVRQAEDVVMRFLARPEPVRSAGEVRSPLGEVSRLHPLEILRDLRSGAFLPAQESRNPFPLTGRARIATEMMELMRTLEAIDRFMQKLEAHLGKDGDIALTIQQPEEMLFGMNGEEALAATLDDGEMAAWQELLAQRPSIPGRKGRDEIENFIRSRGGMLTDTDGHALLVTEDGTPLKLDKLLWLNSAGGWRGAAFDAEQFPARLSPNLMFGFDALYSLIGFDGRTLAPPRFAAVQTQINGSELEWVFGQPPLSEGWMRALIERLKNSAVPDHNSLGEMLEEALLDQRFHAVLVQGSVAEGDIVPDSFAMTKLLTHPFRDPAYA